MARSMFILSCFVVGYVTAKILRGRARVPVGPMVGAIVVLVSVFAVLHVVYEFWRPWLGSIDYPLYRIVVGRKWPSVQTGILAFLLGFAVYLLRSRVLATLHDAGLIAQHCTRGEKGIKARGFP